MAGMRPAAHSEREQQEAEPLPGLRRTVWGQLDLKPRFPKLESHVHADVAVIGGGIAGLSIAYQLQRKGKSTVLLERRCIGQTPSGATLKEAPTTPTDSRFFMRTSAQLHIVTRSHTRPPPNSFVGAE
ncbi:unnamed protein product [Closterium sp. NIES-64]|nr:unnamed protein product [Closterium sp. NIES-64]